MHPAIISVILLMYSSIAVSLAIDHDRAWEGSGSPGIRMRKPAIQVRRGPVGPVLPVNRALQTRVITGQSITYGFMPTPFPDTPYSWILRLRLINVLLPVQGAAIALETFYDRMIGQILLESSSQFNSLLWQYGNIVLEMRSQDPQSNIPFAMVYNLLNELRLMTERALVGTYEGSVTAAMTGWSILIRLRILGRTQPSRIGDRLRVMLGHG